LIRCPPDHERTPAHRRYFEEWLVLTQRESHAIQVGHWSELAEIQKKKAGLQPPLTDVLEQWKVENSSRSLLVFFFRRNRPPPRPGIQQQRIAGRAQA